MTIRLYDDHPELYESIQLQRPDYYGAVTKAVELAQAHLSSQPSIRLVEFCSGTGLNSKRLAERLGSIERCVLVDINPKLLEIAELSGIPSRELNPIAADVLHATIPADNNVVLSMFAYHHIPNDKKLAFVTKAFEALNSQGVVVLAEIYSPDQVTTEKYYAKLVSEMSGSGMSVEMREFLSQTASSLDFEFKISREFCHEQFGQSGFTLNAETKIWPKDNELGEDVGTYVEIWKKGTT